MTNSIKNILNAANEIRKQLDSVLPLQDRSSKVDFVLSNIDSDSVYAKRIISKLADYILYLNQINEQEHNEFEATLETVSKSIVETNNALYGVRDHISQLQDTNRKLSAENTKIKNQQTFVKQGVAKALIALSKTTDQDFNSPAIQDVLAELQKLAALTKPIV